MKTSSRTLVGFGIGIGVLVIVTIILVLTLGKSNPTMLPADSPEGVVQRYLVAIQEKNFPAAYAYLVPPTTSDPNNPKIPPSMSYNDWLASAQYAANSTWKANLGKVIVTGDTANVAVTIDTFRPGGPFGNPVNTNNMTFFLKKAGTSWLINSPTDLYWLY
jgi:hypothetical protein